MTARVICYEYFSATRACGTQSKVECIWRGDEISVDFRNVLVQEITVIQLAHTVLHHNTPAM